MFGMIRILGVFVLILAGSWWGCGASAQQSPDPPIRPELVPDPLPGVLPTLKERYGNRLPGAPPKPPSPLRMIPAGIQALQKRRLAQESEPKLEVSEILTILEHRLWLAVQEGVLSESAAETWRKEIGEAVEDPEFRDLLDPRTGRLAKEAPGEGELRTILDRTANLVARQDQARRERLAVTAGKLALAWFNELLLIHEDDRQAWLENLIAWKSVEGFATALENGRLAFLNRLHHFKLPSVDSSLIRTESQGKLWNFLLTGKYGDEKPDPDNPFALMSNPELTQARRQLFRDGREGIIDREETHRQNRLIQEVIEKNRSRSPEERAQRLRLLVMRIFERQIENLGSLSEPDRRRYQTVVKERVDEWVRPFEGWSQKHWYAWRSRSLRPEIDVIGNVNLAILFDHPLHQEALFEILPLEDWKSWRQNRRRHRSARTEAIKDYALARVSRLMYWSPAQLEQARAVALACDPEQAVQFEQLMIESRGIRERVHEDDARSRGYQDLIKVLGRRIVRYLDSGFMTRWQRQQSEEMLREEEP